MGRRRGHLPRVHADGRGADQRGGAMNALLDAVAACGRDSARRRTDERREAPEIKRASAVLFVFALIAAELALAQTPIETVHVQGNVHMLLGAGGNIAVQVGDDGILVVDTGTAERRDDVLAAIRRLSDKPIRWIVNT